MNVLFLGDTHLKGIEDPAQNELCCFLDGIGNIDKLFILGDLFEFWTGYNTFLHEQYAPVIEVLSKLSKRGVSIIFMEGNHDFSLGDFFTKSIGAEVYPDSVEMVLEGRRFFVTHGDITDMRRGYRLWRWFLRSRLLSIINKIIPAVLGWRIAMKLSGNSRDNMHVGDVVEKRLLSFARGKIREGIDVVVAGHSHVSSVSTEKIADKTGVYANPGDWSSNHTYLRYNKGFLTLKEWSLPIVDSKQSPSRK